MYPFLKMVPFTAKCQRYSTLHCQRYSTRHCHNARGTVPFTAKCQRNSTFTAKGTLYCQMPEAQYPSLPKVQHPKLSKYPSLQHQPKYTGYFVSSHINLVQDIHRFYLLHGGVRHNREQLVTALHALMLRQSYVLTSIRAAW